MKITRSDCEDVYRLSNESWELKGKAKGRIAPVKRDLMAGGWNETSAKDYVTAFFHMMDGTKTWKRDTNSAFADVCLTNLKRDYGEAALASALHAHACYIENFKKKPKNKSGKPPNGHPEVHRRHQRILERLRKNYEPTESLELLEERVAALLADGRIARPTGQASPEPVSSEVLRFKRSPEVKAWVLQEANGICELCDTQGPFKIDDGRWFLEVHHVRPLADGGADVVENAVAVCPNCHRSLHLAVDRDDTNRRLVSRVERLQAGR